MKFEEVLILEMSCPIESELRLRVHEGRSIGWGSCSQGRPSPRWVRFFRPREPEWQGSHPSSSGPSTSFRPDSVTADVSRTRIGRVCAVQSTAPRSEPKSQPLYWDRD